MTEGSVFALRRMRRRAAVLAGVLAVAAVTSAMAGLAAGILAGSATVGVRAALAQEPGSTLALRTALPLAADAGAQDVAVRGVLADSLGPDVPVEVVRDVAATAPVELGGQRTRTAIASVVDLEGSAILVDGAWPTGEAEATLEADAAQRLGLGPGDQVSVGGATLTVTGTWRVADAEDPRWLGDGLWLTGGDGMTTGPLVVADGAWPRLGLDPSARWTVMPDVGRLVPADLARIASGWDRVPSALRDAGLGSPTQTGAFLRAVDEVTPRLAALAAIGPAAGAMVAAVALIALWALVGLLVEGRVTETRLLLARGVTTTRLAAAAAGETAIVALVGGVIGGAVGAATAVAGGYALGLPTALAVAAGSALALPVVVAVLTAARTVAVVRPRAAPTTAARTVGIGAVVLLAAGAAVSAWQLVRYGPTASTAGGGVGVDPVSVVAPALLLAAIVLAGAIAFPVAARVWVRRAARGRGTALAARSVARRRAATAVPIVLVGVAVGQLAIAAGYASTWRTGFDQAEEVAAGTALRITGVLGADDLAAAAGTAGVDAVAPVRTGTVEVGGVTASITGISAAALAGLGARAGGAVDPGRLAETIAEGGGLPPVPVDATTLRIVAAPAPSAAAAWLTDESGATIRLALATGVDGTAEAALPAGRWRLAAVDLTTEPGASTPTVALRAVTTDAGPVALDTAAWTGSWWQDGVLSPGAVGEGPTVTGSPSAEGVRVSVVPAGPVVVVSRSLAGDLGVRVGDPVSLVLRERTVSATVGQVVAAVPGVGGGPAVLVDAAVLQAAALSDDLLPAGPTVAWIGTADVPRAAAALRAALPAAVGVSAPSLDPDLTMLGAALVVVWIAAAGSAVLALAGLLAAAAAQVGARRDETAVLGAIGMSARQQGRSRRIEWAAVVTAGAVVGLVAGGVTVLVVVATLARSAVPAADPALPTGIRFDLPAFALAVAVVALLAAAIVADHGRAVRRLARRSGMPGEGSAR